MDSIELDGYTWWRITPLAEFPRPKYGELAFNPVIFGMSISLWTVALWLALDLLVQIHVTFTRWRGLYYWTVLCTTIGVAIHASLLLVKANAHLSLAHDLGTTVLVKLGDVMTQTGFSLVLYSRLNLVVQTWNPRYLKWVLIAILVSSFMIHTPVIVCTFGINMPPPAKLKWLARIVIAERVIILWFTLQELALLTCYTWNTARLVNIRPLEVSHSLLTHQSKKRRRRLFIFMLTAQAVTFLADLALVVLVYMSMFQFKTIFHPFFYGVKLKVEFLVLNQLQRLAQPNANILGPITDLSSSNLPRQHGANDNSLGRPDVEAQISVHEEKKRSCYPGGRSSSDNNNPIGREMSKESTKEISHICSSLDGSVTDDLERQYLGRYST